MTAWTIASIPFWCRGAILFAGAIVWSVDAIRGKEPLKIAAGNIAFGLVSSGIVFIIAAKIAS